ncbi:MAG TPA: sulfur carrier protein ThiS [Albitalea sp.]|nr:sulfur carrier protein ThiS [Albitalea sp.]
MNDLAAPPCLYVNGEPLAGAEGLTLAGLLARLGEPPEQVATALNGSFVPRDQREGTALAAGDRITVFKAIVGG